MEDKEKLSEKEKNKLNKLFIQLVKSDVEKKLVTGENDKYRKLAVEAMQLFDLTEYELENVEDGKESKSETDLIKNAKIQLISPKSIIYNMEAIFEEFDKEEVSEFVDSTYTINDYAGLKKLLKKYGVPGKAVKKYITRNSTVNENKLKKLYELGEISMKRLAKCYTIKEKESFVKVIYSKDKKDK